MCKKFKLLFIIPNALFSFFFIYFVLRLYGVFEKSIFVPKFFYGGPIDYVYLILILLCVVFLYNIFIYLIYHFEKK